MTKRGAFFLLWVMLILNAGLAYAGAVQLPMTGQTTPYAAGDDGSLQKGVTWPIPRFADRGNGTVTDTLTGLIWTTNANPPGTYKTWQQALDYVAGMNAGNYPNFGYTDWRLPNRKELLSLNDRSRHSPALPLGHPFTNVQNGYYWSSTSSAGLSYTVWLVDMEGGLVSSSAKYYSSYVWPVRSDRAPVLDPIGSQSVNEASPLGFAISGSDPDGDALTFSAADLPAGAAFDPVTRAFSWTPVYGQTGLYSVTFGVSDGVLTDSEVVSITVQQAWFEETDPAITYTGTWNPYACISCSDGNLKYSNQTGARATFSFTGTGIKWITAKGPMMGKALVYLDSVNMGLVDLYGPTVRAKVVLQKLGLSPGSHTVILAVSGQKNVAATDTIIGVDAFEVVP
jgi:hypothetical protein